MKPHPFVMSNSNFAALEAKAHEQNPWRSRRLQNLDDEVGRIRPGKVAVPTHTSTPAEREFEAQGEGNAIRGAVFAMAITATVGLLVWFSRDLYFLFTEVLPAMADFNFFGAR
jgi:hypothetical protein